VLGLRPWGSNLSWFFRSSPNWCDLGRKPGVGWLYTDDPDGWGISIKGNWGTCPDWELIDAASGLKVIDASRWLASVTVVNHTEHGMFWLARTHSPTNTRERVPFWSVLFKYALELALDDCAPDLGAFRPGIG